MLAKQRHQSVFHVERTRAGTEKDLDDNNDEGDLPSSIKRSIANVPIVAEDKHSFYICTRRAWLEACVRDQNDLDRMLEMIQRHAPSGSKLDEMPLIREAKPVVNPKYKAIKNYVKANAAIRSASRAVTMGAKIASPTK